MAEVFPIVPGGAKPLWLLVPMVAICVVAPLILGLSLAGSRYTRFEVSPEGVRLRGDLYGRLVAATDIRGGAARVVDLGADSALQPVRRTMGTAVPGYRSGWFRLRNGEKALLYLTDKSHAVYVPTRAGYALLLSPQEPERFVASVRRIAPGG